MPRVINYILLALAGILPLLNGGKGFGAFCATTIILCGLGLVVLYRLRQGERFTVPVTPHFKTIVSCFYILISLNLFFTVYLHDTIIEWIRITGYLIFYLLLIFSAEQDRQGFSHLTRNMLFAAVILSLVEAIVIIGQNYLHLPPRGTMPNENLAASFILIGFITGLSYLLFNKSLSRLKIVAGILALLLLSAALILSHSRGVLIALFVSLGIISKIRFQKWGLIAAFLIGLGILAFLPVSIFDEIFKMNVPYSYRRIYIWQSTWESIKHRPWFGWGMGNFNLVFPRYNLPSFDTVLHYGKVTRFAHSEILQVAAEAGLLAMLVYSALVGHIVKAGRDLMLRNKTTWINAAAYASFAGIAAHSLVDFNLHLPAITFMAVILGAVLLTENSQGREQTYIISGRIKKTASILLSAMILTIMVFFTSNLFMVKAEKGKNKKAPPETIINDYKKAQFINPLNSYQYEELGRLYAAQYQQENNILAGELAISEYTRASRLNPEEATYYEDLFYLYYSFGSPLPVMELNYVQVMAKNPHLVKPTLVLATFHLQRRNYNRVIQLLSEVIQKEPNWLPAYYYLAKCYEQMKELKLARNNYEIIAKKLGQHLECQAQSNYELQALEVPKIEIFTRLGIFYTLDGKYSAAVSTLNQALALDPEQGETLNALAGAYYSQGQYRKALPYAQKAVRLNPKNLEFRRNLDLCLQKISPSGRP